MTEIIQTPQKKLMLFAGRSHPELAEHVAKELGTPLAPTSAFDFANGEMFIRFEESVRGADAFVLQSHSPDINKWIMEQLIMVDALKRASAKRITVIMPFYGYARQDKKHRGREPITARLMADLFRTAGADRLMAIDLHTGQIQGFFDGPVDHLFALPVMSQYVAEHIDLSQATVVEPRRRAGASGGAVDRCAGFAAGDHPQASRPGRAQRGEGVRGRGRRRGPGLCGGRRHDRHRRHDREGRRHPVRPGAADVIVTATHGVLSDPATERLKNSRISEVIVTDTLPIPPEKRLDKLTVLPIAPMIAKAISEVFTDGSVTSLFGSPHG